MSQAGSRWPASVTARVAAWTMVGSCSPSSTKTTPLAENWIMSQNAARRTRVSAITWPARSIWLITTPALTAANMPEPPTFSASM